MLHMYGYVDVSFGTRQGLFWPYYTVFSEAGGQSGVKPWSTIILILIIACLTARSSSGGTVMYILACEFVYSGKLIRHFKSSRAQSLPSITVPLQPHRRQGSEEGLPAFAHGLSWVNRCCKQRVQVRFWTEGLYYY